MSSYHGGGGGGFVLSGTGVSPQQHHSHQGAGGGGVSGGGRTSFTAASTAGGYDANDEPKYARDWSKLPTASSSSTAAAGSGEFYSSGSGHYQQQQQQQQQQHAPSRPPPAVSSSSAPPPNPIFRGADLNSSLGEFTRAIRQPGHQQYAADHQQQQQPPMTIGEHLSGARSQQQQQQQQPQSVVLPPASSFRGGAPGPVILNTNSTNRGSTTSNSSGDFSATKLSAMSEGGNMLYYNANSSQAGAPAHNINSNNSAQRDVSRGGMQQYTPQVVAPSPARSAAAPNSSRPSSQQQKVPDLGDARLLMLGVSPDESLIHVFTYIKNIFAAEPGEEAFDLWSLSAADAGGLIQRMESELLRIIESGRPKHIAPEFKYGTTYSQSAVTEALRSRDKVLHHQHQQPEASSSSSSGPAAADAEQQQRFAPQQPQNVVIPPPPPPIRRGGQSQEGSDGTPRNAPLGAATGGGGGAPAAPTTRPTPRQQHHPDDGEDNTAAMHHQQQQDQQHHTSVRPPPPPPGGVSAAAVAAHRDSLQQQDASFSTSAEQQQQPQHDSAQRKQQQQQQQQRTPSALQQQQQDGLQQSQHGVLPAAMRSPSQHNSQMRGGGSSPRRGGNNLVDPEAPVPGPLYPDRKLKETMHLLRTGAVLTKFALHSDGKPQLRFFRLDNQPAIVVQNQPPLMVPHLCWSSDAQSTPSTYLCLMGLQDVILGANSPNIAGRFKRNARGQVVGSRGEPLPANMCITYVFPEREINICAPTERDFDVWYYGMKQCLDRNRQGKYDQREKVQAKHQLPSVPPME